MADEMSESFEEHFSKLLVDVENLRSYGLIARVRAKCNVAHAAIKSAGGQSLEAAFTEPPECTLEDEEGWDSARYRK